MKRTAALLLAAAMIMAVMPFSMALADKPAQTPIYVGYLSTDVIAEMLLDEIGAREIQGDYERIQAVYDWIITHCDREGEWDEIYMDIDSIEANADQWADKLNGMLDDGQIALLSMFDEINIYYEEAGANSPYSLGYFANALALYRVGNCMHYSSLLSVLLQHLGYECYVVPGDYINRDGSTVMHKWNMVYVNGRPYWLDVRMDHSGYSSTGRISYTYFLKTDDADWALRHSWDTRFTDALRAQHELGRHSYYFNGVDYACLEAPQWTKASAWAESYLTAAQNRELIPQCLQGADMTRAITREEFASLAITLYEAMAGRSAQMITSNPFGDTENRDVLKAYGLGVVNGESPDTFNPSGLLTREQGAAMLGRVFEAVSNGQAGDGSRLEIPVMTPFADNSEISGYAVNYVYFMNYHNIINGKENSRFDPWGKTTREEAIKIAVMMVENLK